MFPNNKTLSCPLYFIGLIMIICGVRWLIHPEPWMLDEVANVDRLGMAFDQLFEPEINATLPLLVARYPGSLAAVKFFPAPA